MRTVSIHYLYTDMVLLSTVQVSDDDDIYTYIYITDIILFFGVVFVRHVIFNEIKNK